MLAGKDGNPLVKDAVYAIKADGKTILVSAGENEILLVGTDTEGKAYDLVGKDLTVIKKSSDKDTFEDSDSSESVNVPERGTISEDEIAKEITKDGTKVTIPEGYAYKEEGSDAWKNGADEILVEAGKTVEVKKSATATALASDPMTVTARKEETVPENASGYG